MAVPNFETILVPALRLSGDGKLRTLAEVRNTLAVEFALTPVDLAEVLPSGSERRWNNRVSWACFYLTKAGLLEKPRRGCVQITALGREVLTDPPEKMDVDYLRRFPPFLEFEAQSGAPHEVSPTPTAVTPEIPPDETIDKAYRVLRAALAADLLKAVKDAPPHFFEKVVVELLIKMGYGGTHAGAGRAIGQSGDEGIDGVIDEDRLGLDKIYLQAKRWEGTVGRPEIQKFVGALHGKKATKGVFLTTSAFSADARDYVEQITPRVVLIDGPQLADHMIDFGLGVTTRAVFELKRLDSDYFIEE